MSKAGNDYSNKNVLILDNGLGCAHAERIARDVASVWYWTPFLFAFPKIEDFAKGFGLENVEKVTKPFKYIDKADLIYIPDIGFGDIASFLRKKGYTVFNAGERAEEFEFDRFTARMVQDKLGLPVQYTQKVKGLDNLETVLRDNKHVYVKPHIFRGTKEVAYISDDRKARSYLRNMNEKFGAMRNDVFFLVEDEVKNPICEYGMDLLFNGTSFLTPYCGGIEHNSSYLGHIGTKLPVSIRHTMEALAPLFHRLGYRGAFSDEEIIVSPHKSFLLDWTVRYPYPLSVIWTETYLNYTELIFKIASGEDAKIEPLAEFIGCLPLSSTEAGDDWLYIDYPSDLSPHFKPIYGCRTKEGFHAVKGFDTCLTVVAWGDSPKKVANELKDLSKEVEADELERNTSSLDYILESIDKMESLNIPF